MVKQIFPVSLAFVVFIFKLDQKVLLITSNADLSDIMNNNFKVDTATEPKTKLAKLQSLSSHMDISVTTSRLT